MIFRTLEVENYEELQIRGNQFLTAASIQITERHSLPVPPDVVPSFALTGTLQFSSVPPSPKPLWTRWKAGPFHVWERIYFEEIRGEMVLDGSHPLYAGTTPSDGPFWAAHCRSPQ